MRIIYLGDVLPRRSSGLPAAIERAGTLPLLGLAPGEVYRAAAVAGSAVGSYPTISPLRRRRAAASCGFRLRGIFSVALSVRPVDRPGSYPAPYPVEPGLSSLEPARARRRTTSPAHGDGDALACPSGHGDALSLSSASRRSSLDAEQARAHSPTAAWRQASFRPAGSEGTRGGVRRCPHTGRIVGENPLALSTRYAGSSAIWPAPASGTTTRTGLSVRAAPRLQPRSGCLACASAR